MGLFNKKGEAGSENPVASNLDEQLSGQATRLGLSIAELKGLSVGKSCPKYGTAELLHARRVRGGKIVVFNISEKYRGEKISEGRKKIKSSKASADATSDEVDKK
jgi:hypothetical protein